jgi:hypothetical protein
MFSLHFSHSWFYKNLICCFSSQFYLILSGGEVCLEIFKDYNMRRFIICGLLLSWSAFSIATQQINVSLPFGDEAQPGTRLYEVVVQRMEQGRTTPQAISGAIDQSMTEEDTTLTPEAKSAVAFNIPLTNAFYKEMLVVNSLIEVTKTLIEENPERVIEVITLGVVLYPSFSQEVLDGAALTGVIIPSDALLAALQAGADPALVSISTASGEPIIDPIDPIGIGIGGDGGGGGGSTASTN